ncbi:CD1247 N-terminal domain-containing protein [uncultured Clostridium sp.]|uniref:CD1247 N-terminal domain-containing protein n=1 Tax=uncultured Clostridium sp. TaxID=59620 RepID=UPI0025D0A4BB|nr:CD1247 N-terminal domain-containing protein [uncultured Clostridium sp.]
MEELRKQIEEFQTSLSDIKDDAYRNYFEKIESILNSMADKIEEVVVNQETMEENMQFLDDDLSNIQDELFEEVSIDELCDMEDEYVEVKCTHCNKPIFMEKSALESKDKIPCPYCHNNIK